MVNQYLIGLVLAVIVLGGSGWGGWAARGWYQDHKTLPLERAEREAEVAQEQRQREALQATLTALQQSRSVHTEVIREVAKIEYRDRPCLDPDAVRLLNAAAKDIAAAPAADQMP